MHHSLHSHTGCVFLFSSTVSFQVIPQIACPRGCKVTLFAFVEPFLNLSCGLSHVSSNWMHHSMHSHTGCIYLAFLCCGLPNVSSDGLPVRKQSHTVCICSTFAPCGLSHVSSSWIHHGMHSHIGCICLTCPYCGFLNVSSYYPLHRNPVTGCIIALAAFVWLFHAVHFQMCPRMTCR